MSNYSSSERALHSKEDLVRLLFVCIVGHYSVFLINIQPIWIFSFFDTTTDFWLVLLTFIAFYSRTKRTAALNTFSFYFLWLLLIIQRITLHSILYRGHYSPSGSYARSLCLYTVSSFIMRGKIQLFQCSL